MAPTLALACQRPGHRVEACRSKAAVRYRCLRALERVRFSCVLIIWQACGERSHVRSAERTLLSGCAYHGRHVCSAQHVLLSGCVYH